MGEDCLKTYYRNLTAATDHHSFCRFVKAKPFVEEVTVKIIVAYFYLKKQFTKVSNFLESVKFLNRSIACVCKQKFILSQLQLSISCKTCLILWLQTSFYQNCLFRTIHNFTMCTLNTLKNEAGAQCSSDQIERAMKALGPHLKEELNVPYHPEACECTFFEVLLIEIYFNWSNVYLIFLCLMIKHVKKNQKQFPLKFLSCLYLKEYFDFNSGLETGNKTIGKLNSYHLWF